MKKWNLMFLVLIIMTVLGCGEKRELVQLKGSDTILNLGQVVSEQMMQEDKNIKIAVTGGGSGTGIAALLNGTVDIAQASRPIKSKEITKAQEAGINVKEWTVAFDGITVVVNKENGVKNLSSEQLRSIFIGEIKNWKELGGQDLDIIALSRDTSSGTHVFFKEHILRMGNAKSSEEYRSDVIYLPSNQSIIEETAKNSAAIGYIGMGYMTDEVKAISVDGVSATVENVADKKYPISRGLYWYTNGETQGSTRELIDFMFSEKGQELVKKEGFVPVR